MPRSTLIGASLSFGALLGAGFAAQSVPAAALAAGAISTDDKGGEETLDLAEVKSAAGARFDKLDRDSDGTLDRKEVEGVVGKEDFKAADSDGDGTLSKDEYVALVERLFMKVDIDHDGRLTVQELRSAAARALKPLID
jgi:hypothetical protein